MALFDHEDHLDIDDEETDKLPNDAVAKEFRKRRRDHCGKGFIIGSDILGDGVIDTCHIVLLFVFFIRESGSSPA